MGIIRRSRYENIADKVMEALTKHAHDATSAEVMFGLLLAIIRTWESHKAKGDTDKCTKSENSYVA